jgi:hypothetical protein
MSIRYNNNELFISWKGKTFNQITSVIKKNGIINKSINISNKSLFHPLPLKINRREIASVFDMSNCNSKTSIKINEFDMPNGTINNSKLLKQNGLVNTLDINLTSNTSERPELCKDNCILSQADNAKRRLRSSGMIKRKFNESKNNDTYYTSSNQYLVSRNRTFQQNQYNYLRTGISTAKPGDSLSNNNLYSPQGISHCNNNISQTYYKPNNPQFAQQGAVTSSSLTARLKYNSITNSTVLYRNALGKAVGNALAYGVSENGYTLKDKIGYPLTKTPVFSKYNNIVKSCFPRKTYSA